MRLVGRFQRSRADPRRILDHELLVPTPDEGAEPRGRRITGGNEKISLLVMTDENGLAVLPAFTSEAALRRWRPQGSRYVGLQGRVVVEMLANSDWDRILVDGADATAVAITQSAARGIVGMAGYVLSAGSTLLLGEPATPPPDGMRDALLRACELQPLISEAYLFQLAIDQRDEVPHLTVGLALGGPADEAETRRVVGEIGSAIEPSRWGYDFVDISVLDAEMLDEVRAVGPPVYHRGEPGKPD